MNQNVTPRVPDCPKKMLHMFDRVKSDEYSIYIIAQKTKGINNLDNLFLKNTLNDSVLFKSNIPLSITKIGIEKSLRQSKNATAYKLELFKF